MKNNINNRRFKTIQNYSTTMKRPIPISILSSENTIFIKTNQNKLTSNYLRNGNQIRHNKHFLSTTINPTQKLSNSLKNTFSLRKSNFTTKMDKKNMNDINNKLIEILNNNKIQNKYYKGTNSFIKIDRRNKKNNLSSINTINENNNDNQIFNYFKNITKLNTSSVKRKYKMQNRLIKDNDIQNRVFDENEKEKNNFSSTYTIGIKKSALKPSSKTKKNSISKISDLNINKTMFFKKLNYTKNNLSNLIKSCNYENIYFSALNSYMDKEKDYNNNRIKKNFFYSRRLNNKYIYSIEKKKEKSLAEKRQRAKKPISYLIKNNYLNAKDNPTNTNRISNDLNNEKNRINKIIRKTVKRKNTNSRIINYKKNIYNIDNYNYTIKVESEEKNKNRKVLDMKETEFNNDNFKTLPNFEEGNKILKINKDILTTKNLNESNNIVNNNYYNINNTFIFDTNGNKLAQYDLTKLITKSNKNLDYNFINNYNSNNYKTIDTDIQRRNRNNIIKNINKDIKMQTKPGFNMKTKNKNINYYKIDLNNNKNNNNKLNINKISNFFRSNLIRNKNGQNDLQFLSIDNKNNMTNLLKKGINKNSKNINKIQLKNIKENKIEKLNYISNKQKNLNIKKSLDFYNIIKLTKKLNHNSVNEPTINRKKSDKVSKISKYIKTNNFNSDTLELTLNNRENDSINNKKMISRKGKKDIKVLNIDSNNNIRENKIISYKILTNNNKNKSYNIDNLNNGFFEQQKNNDSNNNNKISKGYEIFFNKYENKENISNNDDDKYSINTFEIDEEENEENNDNYKNQNQSSFELITLAENNLFENNKTIKVENENNDDNFDDINSIIKKIDFNECENMDKDIFSLNNNKYKEFNKLFDKKFDELFNK